MTTDVEDDDSDPELKTFRQFAAARSNQDSKLSNENSRAAAQAAILINGGAASGLLAFLSKDKIDPHVLSQAALSLGAYAAGVFAGALMIFSMNQALKHWNASWIRLLRDPRLDVTDTPEDKLARPWFRFSNFAFACSIIAFVVGSVMLAVALNSPPSPSATTAPVFLKKGP